MNAPAPTMPTEAFLSANGLGGCVLTPLVADASARRYYRVEGRGLLLMEDRTDPVGFAAYLRVSAHLIGRGVSAPRVLASDAEHGLALIEDFGDATYSRCLAEGQDEEVLYRLAIELLLQLHRDPGAADVAQPRYETETYLNELEIFAEWFLPVIAPKADTARFAAAWHALWRGALAPVAGRFETLVLRDFHVDNLMLLPDRTGVARCGVLDFQDGIIGPCEYDLVSLLQDARRDLSKGLEARLLAQYIADAPEHLGPPHDIRHRYALLGAQRHARILGVFIRLHRRDGKSGYLRHIPRVLAQFSAALDAAELLEIKGLLDETAPGWWRAEIRRANGTHSAGEFYV